jgi:hypothetical protein
MLKRMFYGVVAQMPPSGVTGLVPRNPTIWKRSRVGSRNMSGYPRLGDRCKLSGMGNDHQRLGPLEHAKQCALKRFWVERGKAFVKNHHFGVLQ